MMISSGTLAVIVSCALVVTLLAPLVLLGLWIKDWRKGQLW